MSGSQGWAPFKLKADNLLRSDLNLTFRNVNHFEINSFYFSVYWEDIEYKCNFFDNWIAILVCFLNWLSSLRIQPNPGGSVSNVWLWDRDDRRWVMPDLQGSITPLSCLMSHSRVLGYLQAILRQGPIVQWGASRAQGTAAAHTAEGLPGPPPTLSLHLLCILHAPLGGYSVGRETGWRYLFKATVCDL